MNYKQLADLERMIERGARPEALDGALASYIAGQAYLDHLDAGGTLADWEPPADLAEQVAAWKISNYEMLRRAAYPDPAMYLDAQVKDDADQEAEYKAACLAVKVAWPKE